VAIVVRTSRSLTSVKNVFQPGIYVSKCVDGCDRCFLLAFFQLPSAHQRIQRATGYLSWSTSELINSASMRSRWKSPIWLRSSWRARICFAKSSFNSLCQLRIASRIRELQRSRFLRFVLWAYPCTKATKHNRQCRARTQQQTCANLPLW